MQNRIYFLILIIVFFVAFFLRFYKLGEVPYGFYQDESAIGYNAYSIMQTGKDEHGQLLPLYFKSFGDYKLPVYVYSAIIPIKLFGLTEFAVRFPSALFGFLTVVIFFFFVKEISKDARLALVAIALLAVNPWHLHYSRATFEVSMSLFLFVLGGFLLHKSLATGKKGLFFGGTVCFVLNVYTYNLTRFLSPLLFSLIVFINRHQVKSLFRKEVLITGFVSVVLLVPFFSTLLRPEGVSSGLGTFILTSASIQSQLLEFRSYLLGFPDFFEKIFFNQLALTKWQYLGNIASYLSAPFFFVSGSPHGNHGIGNVGQFYLFELPLIIFGVVQIFRKKLQGRFLLILWGIIVILVASLTRESPHATRSFFLLVPLVIFSSFGLISTWEWLQRSKFLYKAIFIIFFGGFAFYNLLFYFSSYYVRFPIFYAKAWRSQDKALSLYIKENQHKYDKILFDKKAGFIYTSFLFYTSYDPFDLQRTVERAADDSEGFSEVISFGKYEFKDIDWSKDLEQNALIITSLDRKLPETVPLKTFSYPTRPVVISVGQKIAQYPVDESAYVLVESR